MGIKIFTFVLLLFVIIAYFIPVKNVEKFSVDKDLPLVIFENPKMYTIDDKNINRVVIATHAIKYQTRDEMYNADIKLKNQDSSKDFKYERLKAELIVKNGDVYTLTDRVEYTRDNFIKFNTNHLIYDDKNKIVKNNESFDAFYNNNYLKGSTLYFDINNDYFTAKNTHFEIDVTNKQ